MDGMQKDMNYLCPSSRAFAAIRTASVEELSKLNKRELRPILPCLARTALCAPLDISDRFRIMRKEIQKIMSGVEAVNSIVSLLSVDFSTVQEDAIKEQQLRKKLGGNSLTESILAESLQTGLLLEFERSEPSRRMRLVLSEILRLCSMITEEPGRFLMDDSELFDCMVYLEEISDVLCIAFAELPGLLPIREVTGALLRVRCGPWLLCRLVSNAPDCFEQVCSYILSNSKSVDENNLETQIRTKTLQMLCTMNPSFCKPLRTEAITRCKLPGLVIELSVSHHQKETGSDVVPFLSGLLLTGGSKEKEWLAEYIKVAQKDHPNSSISTLRKQLLKEINNVIERFPTAKDNPAEAMEVDSEQDGSVIIQGVAILRLYCGLKGMVGYKISSEESEAILKLITCPPPPSAAGVRFILVGLCTLMASTFIISNPEREEIATQWIEWLCSHHSDFEKIAGVPSSFGQMLLLIAIHFHGNNLEAIVELISSTLGMRLRPGSLTKMKILFTQQIFPEKVVAEHALTVPVTPGLNSNITGFLPVHCVHQLLKTRVFSKYSMNVKDWIYRQLCTATAPLHPLMLPLIEEYTHSVISPVHIGKTVHVGKTGKHQKGVALVGFTEEEILHVFEKENKTVELSCHVTSQLLMLLYVLSYQDYLLSQIATLVNTPHCPKEYPSTLYEYIPIKKLLLKSRANQECYGDLYPPLLRLLTKHYPHLCLVEDYMFEEETMGSTDSKFSYSKQMPFSKNQKAPCSVDDLQRALHNANTSWSRALILLSRLTSLEPSLLEPYTAAIVGSFPALMVDEVPRKIQMITCFLWYKLNTVIPRRLWLETVNVLCNKNAKYPLQCQPYTDEEVTKDPLIVLKCDKRVFRCPPVFDILLRILAAYMAASRALLAHHLQSHPLPVSPKSNAANTGDLEREELKNALVAAQESACIQILLEVCLPTTEERKVSSVSVSHNLREIQCKVCSFLHQVFISDPNMMKLVHFQGYPEELLSVTVAGVPSMHICLDFIPELLNQPQLEKQLFAIQLLSHLALQYPMPKSLSIAKHILIRLTALQVALPAERRNQFFLPVMPCLKRICLAFPPTIEEITGLLLSLGKVLSCQINKDSITTINLKYLVENEVRKTEEQVDGGFLDTEGDDLQLSSLSIKNSRENENHRTVGTFSLDEELFIEVNKTFKNITNDFLSDRLSVNIRR